MCLNCLKLNLESIDKYDRKVTEYLENTTCECCKLYPSFLKSVNEDLRVLCLTKMKNKKQMCYKQLTKTIAFEEALKSKIKDKLQDCMEQIDEISGEIDDGRYLSKANNLKALNDLMNELEVAEHN